MRRATRLRDSHILRVARVRGSTALPTVYNETRTTMRPQRHVHCWTTWTELRMGLLRLRPAKRVGDSPTKFANAWERTALLR